MGQVMATARDYYFQQCKRWAEQITETEVNATKVILHFLSEVGWDFIQEYEIKSIGKFIELKEKDEFGISDYKIFYYFDSLKHLKQTLNKKFADGYKLLKYNLVKSF